MALDTPVRGYGRGRGGRGVSCVHGCADAAWLRGEGWGGVGGESTKAACQAGPRARYYVPMPVF